MSSFDYIDAISLGDMSFDLEEFLNAAQGAVNGNSSTAVTLNDQKTVVFSPTDEEYSLRYFHPDSFEGGVLRDERFAILLESAIERENALYRNRSWFDSPEHEMWEAVAAIATTENLSKRMQLVEEWRQSSIEIFYKNLHDQIREQKNISFPNLLPPKGNKFLDTIAFSLHIVHQPCLAKSFLRLLNR